MLETCSRSGILGFFILIPAKYQSETTPPCVLDAFKVVHVGLYLPLKLLPFLMTSNQSIVSALPQHLGLLLQDPHFHKFLC